MKTRLIALIRAARLALHLAYGLALAVIYPWFSAALRRHILQRWSLSLLHIFNVHIKLDDDGHRTARHGLIVANHISWLDVFALNAVLPMRFVAKSEVRRWPVIGWLCARAQTLFIERGKGRAAARMNVQLVELLQQGERLAVFPEGTTTDGRRIAHFHSSLLQPAIDAGTDVHPVALRYQDTAGELCTSIAYIDDISFGSSLWTLLCTPALHVQLVATAPLAVQNLDRRTVARIAHERIGTALQTASPLHSVPPSAREPAGSADNEELYQPVITST